MGELATKVALVTGANSGLGFEAAAQLVEAGAQKVILACRTAAKAEAARGELVRRTGRQAFGVLALDTSDAAAATTAAEHLAQSGEVVDLLLLNAGMSARTLQTTAAGVDQLFASALVGHHALTVGLLEHGGLERTARIVIAGSEAARGDVPAMGALPVDVREVANERFGGDLQATMVAIAKGEVIQPYDPAVAYATAKCMAVWWAAALADRLPRGMAVFAVSPGAAPATGFARNMPFVTRRLMMPTMRVVGSVVGATGSVAKAARRYVEAASFTTEYSGSFFASRPRRMVGPLVRDTDTPHLIHPELHDAFWPAIVQLTGVDVSAAESSTAAIDVGPAVVAAPPPSEE
ncbi:MAG: SDR family NAD(P)-dependent oxidoreductase [Myxococcales bacterium]|nr:SDR family NAD(P)-dependent oxidoreductase [Myxococcales bacterium]